MLTKQTITKREGINDQASEILAKMVFLNFPSSLTEEEQMLQRKYAQLRKKKKQLAAIKNSTEEVSCDNL